MVTYLEKHIESSDYAIFLEIERLLNDLTIPNLGRNELGEDIEMSCHMISEALSRIYKELHLLHGYFMSGFEHCWLVTSSGNIIDPYPFGIGGGPLIVARAVVTSNFYRINERVAINDRELPSFKRCVNELETELCDILNSYQTCILPSTRSAI